MVTFVEHFPYYLYGRPFTIRTDHASLRWPLNFKTADGMLARWLTKLERYNYTFVHRKGSQHTNADALSRIPIRKCPRADCTQCTRDVCPISTELPAGRPESLNLILDQNEWLKEWTLEELQNWQRADTAISQVIEWLESSHERPPWKDVVRFYNTTKAFTVFTVGNTQNGQWCSMSRVVPSGDW